MTHCPGNQGLWTEEQKTWGLALPWLEMARPLGPLQSRQWCWLSSPPRMQGEGRPSFPLWSYLEFSERWWTWRSESRADRPSLPLGYPWRLILNIYRVFQQGVGRVRQWGRVDRRCPERQGGRGSRWEEQS